MQSPNRFYYTWRLLFLHLSFARCFFFYLSFLFPPVEPGAFNCCETIKNQARCELHRAFIYTVLSRQSCRGCSRSRCYRAAQARLQTESVSRVFLFHSCCIPADRFREKRQPLFEPYRDLRADLLIADNTRASPHF